MNIAIVGTGEMSRMMALAGWPMGFRFSFLAEDLEASHPVRGLGNVVRRSECASVGELYLALGCPGLITIANQDCDTDLLEQLSQYCSVFPDPDRVATSQNRLSEKLWLEHMGVPILSYEVSVDKKMLVSAVRRFKHAKLQHCTAADSSASTLVTGADEVEALADVNCEQCYLVQPAAADYRQFSIAGVRNSNGEIVLYAATEHHLRQGHLLWSIAPTVAASESMVFEARQLLCRLLDRSGHVGAMTIDCLATDQGVVAERVIPGVDRRLSWTTQGAATSLFENHIRAIAGLPLGSSHTLGVTGTITLQDLDLDPRQINLSNTQVHLYGNAANGRHKSGHLNINCNRQEQLRVQLSQMLAQLYPRIARLPGTTVHASAWSMAG